MLKKLTSLGKSRSNIWNKMEKLFAHIELVRFHFIQKNFYFFLKFNYTMNKRFK